jgi:hypothetical protein
MADDIRELVLRLLVQIPDAKVPALDTKEAEAALERLREKGRAVQKELENVGRTPVSPGGMPGGSPGGYSPGGPVMPVFQPGRTPTYQPWQPGGIPMPAVPPGGLFVNPNQYPSPIGPQPRPYGPWGAGATPIYPSGSATMLSGPWNGPGYYGAGGPSYGAAGVGMSFGGPAYGPVSDPGSAGTASPNARSGPMRDFIGQIHTLEKYDQGVQKLTASLRNFREAAISAAAGTLMLEHGMESGSVMQMGLGGLMLGDSAVRIASGTPNLIRRGAGAASGVLARGMRMAGPGMLSGAMGAVGGYLGGIAGQATLTGLAGAVAAPAAVIAAAAYGGYSLYTANRDNNAAIAMGQSLDEQTNFARARGFDLADYSRIGAQGLFTAGAARQASVDAMRFQGGGMSLAALQARTTDRLGQIGLRSNALAGEMESFAGGGESQKAIAAGEQLARNYQTQLQLIREMNQARRADLQTQLEKVNAAQREAEATRDAAQGAASRLGGNSQAQFRRGLAFYGRAMADGSLDEREATRLERMGFGDGVAVRRFRRSQGQSFTDEAVGAGARDFLPEESRTSEEMKKLADKIKTLEADRKALNDSFLKTFEAEALAMQAFSNRMGVLEKKMNDLALRGGNSGGGR